VAVAGDPLFVDAKVVALPTTPIFEPPLDEEVELPPDDPALPEKIEPLEDPKEEPKLPNEPKGLKELKEPKGSTLAPATVEPTALDS